MKRGSGDYYNHEGYPDPTAYEVIKNEKNLETKVTLLIKALRTVISLCGFELVGRIELRDVKTGRFFK